MELYKLTNSKGLTYNKTYWEEGSTHQVKWNGKMCSPGCLHAYIHPMIAVICDPFHARIICRANGVKLFKAEGKVHLNDGTKVGCKRLTTLEQIPIPIVTSIERIALAILHAKEAAHLELHGKSLNDWNNWAYNWLSGEDRTDKTRLKIRREILIRGVWTTPTATAAAITMARPPLAVMETEMTMRTIRRAYRLNPSIDQIALCEKATKFK